MLTVSVVRLQSDAELYPLLSIPESELTPEQVKEKRKQRLMKNAADSRERQRKEKESAKEKDRQIAEAEEAKRLADPIGFIKELRERRFALVTKREARKKARAGLFSLCALPTHRQLTRWDRSTVVVVQSSEIVEALNPRNVCSCSFIPHMRAKRRTKDLV